VEFELAGDWMHNYQTKIPDQLAAGIRVLMYAGDQDYICNVSSFAQPLPSLAVRRSCSSSVSHAQWLGNQAWTKALAWPGKAAFNSAKLRNFTVEGQAAGSLRQAQGFSFLQVFEAGHMVPRDQPKHALGMLNAFLRDVL
jgi:carboxypeptidase C (cathepsin A)